MKSIRFVYLVVVLLTSAFILDSCSSGKKMVSIVQENREVVILAVNDMHATIDNFPRLAFIVDSLRLIYPDMLLFSGGDNQTGNPVNDQYSERGLPMIQLMNALKFDLSAIGNHEFDTNAKGFSSLTKQADFDFICSNLETPSGLDFKIKPYKFIKLPNGLKLGIASVLYINSNGIPDSHPDNVKGFQFFDPITTAKKYLHLKDSCEVLIFLNHYGFENDVVLANSLPKDKVDLIIGAHSHTKVDKEQIHNGILITQAERKLKYATLIKIRLDAHGKVTRSMQLLNVGRKGSENANVRTIVDKFNDNPVLNEQLAIADTDLSTKEQVGYLMVDAMRAGTKTDIAINNPGGIRISSLPKGSITIKDVYMMDPFGNDIVQFTLSGKELKALMMNAYNIDDQSPIIPSGIRIRYIINKDKSLKNVEIFTTQGQPLEMDKTYTVAMNSYMASVYKYDHQDKGRALKLPTADNLIQYLKDSKHISGYGNEHRIETITE